MAGLDPAIHFVPPHERAVVSRNATTGLDGRGKRMAGSSPAMTGAVDPFGAWDHTSTIPRITFTQLPATVASTGPSAVFRAPAMIWLGRPISTPCSIS